MSERFQDRQADARFDEFVAGVQGSELVQPNEGEAYDNEFARGVWARAKDLDGFIRDYVAQERTPDKISDADKAELRKLLLYLKGSVDSIEDIIK
jgi:transcription termination factor NusB